jgi:hypothetical protein
MTTRLQAIARTLAFASLITLAAQSTAQRRAGGTTRSTTVNRNTNVNVNRNVNVDVNRPGYHPVARGAVAGATARAVMGSYYATLPTGCVRVVRVGVDYYHCGTTWYQTVGTQYLVVPQP